MIAAAIALVSDQRFTVVLAARWGRHWIVLMLHFSFNSLRLLWFGLWLPGKEFARFGIRPCPAAFLPGPPANALNSARSPGASMQIHFNFRCRFTIRCNTIIRNYMRMTAIIHNYPMAIGALDMRRSLHAAVEADPNDR